MEHTIVLNVGAQAQVNTNGVTGVAPIFLYRNHVSQGVHSVEDHEVRLAIKVDHGVGGLLRLQLMFSVRRIDHRLAILFKAIPIGIAMVWL